MQWILENEINLNLFFAGDFGHQKDTWQLTKVELKLSDILNISDISE